MITCSSWKLVATALSDVSGQRQSSTPICNFFADDFVQSLLKNPARAFCAPDEGTRKDFETKTAPINTTSAAASEVDIKQFKEDAEWLSKNGKVNLTAALRVVVVEHQSRSSRHLLGPLSSQDATNLQEAAGLSDGQGAVFLSNLGASAAQDADEIAAEFEKPESRRRRLFDIFLEERRSFAMAMDYANTFKLYNRFPFYFDGADQLATKYGFHKSSNLRDDIDQLLPAYFKLVTNSTAAIESGLASVTDDSIVVSEQTEIDFLRTLLTETIHAFSVIYQLVDSLGAHFPQPNIVNQWFSLMEMYRFFDSVQAIHPSIAGAIAPLKTLCSAISIILLQPARASTYFAEREEDATQADDSYDSYLLSSDVLEQVHKSIINAASLDLESASPAILAWTLILHRMNASYHNRTEKRDNLLHQNARETFETGAVIRPTLGRRNSAGSMYSIESSKFDGFLENATTPRDMQVVEQLAASVTVNGRVFDVISDMSSSLGPNDSGCLTAFVGSRVRIVFLELLKVSYPFVGYQSDTVGSLLSLLSPGRKFWDLTSKESLNASQDTIKSMLNDDHIMDFYFRQALERFPYEFLPFVGFCRSICTAANGAGDERAEVVLDLLRSTPSLTFTLPDDFQEFELVQEDENTNSFALIEELPLITLSSSWKRRYIDDEAYRLPVGTYGRFITDSGKVAMMEYPHSTISLLGRLLEISLMKEGYQSLVGNLKQEDIAEVISLFAIIFRMESLNSEGTAGTLISQDDDLLAEASKHISGGKDIVTVVCDTMDYYMQDELAMNEDSAVNIITACIEFLDAVLPAQPSRVWSYLARCELLGTESRAGKLTKITGSLDLVSERFELLNSSLKFFGDLIDTVLASGVQRKAGNNPSSRQQEHNAWLGTADKVLSNVSKSIAHVSVDVFENTTTWRFESEANRTLLLASVAPILDKLIIYAYSMGDSATSETLTSSLRPAASYIIDCFITPSSGTLRFQPILSSFVTAFLNTESSLSQALLNIDRQQLTSVLSFCTTLLRVANFMDKSSTMLESYLFKSSTLLARLCATSDIFRTPTLLLLQALVINAGKSSNEPPSLLGYLGPQISKSFLNILATLAQPFVLPDDVKTVWKFFSSILRNRQQWMSNCLLTGQTPREAMKKDAKTKEVADHAVFATALSKLKVLGTLETTEALSVCDFVASAQNYWPWTVFTLQKDTSYIEGLRKYMRELRPSGVTARSDAIKASREARIAAYVAETFAMQLYHVRHLGNAESLAKSLLGDLDYFLRDGVEVAGYNKSLHANFAKNFAKKYYGCSVDNFKKSLLEPRELGTSYYYDLARADKMLSFDANWLGKKANGFKNEMELANANLALVDAQIALFHSWEFLLVELSAALPGDATVAKQMLQVAQQCLNANQGVPGPESIFLKLVESRANLALVLIQRLARSKLPIKDINQLLSTLAGTLNGVDEPFASSSISYYRTLLKALFVTLRAYQIHDNKGEGEGQNSLASSTVTVTQIVLNLLDSVVGRGFRALVSLVHDRDNGIYPEDFGLLTAITQACLCLPNIEQAQTQILNIMASHDVVNAATSLFSWADQLAINGDPVYGELSVLFLLELSTMSSIAEQLACDGILSNLMSANITKFMLKTNISPNSEAPVSQRSYGIWVKGLLPLMLNFLTSLGAAVAPEIAYVLNQFSHLLKASVDRFEAPGASRTSTRGSERYLTLLATSEAHSLALLTRVLTALRANNNRDIPAVDWDAPGLLENVEYWLSSRRLLKERLLPLGQREMEWRGTKVSEDGCDNLLEQKIVAQLEVVRDVLSEEFAS